MDAIQNPGKQLKKAAGRKVDGGPGGEVDLLSEIRNGVR